MIGQEEIKKAKEIVEAFLLKMTMTDVTVTVNLSSNESATAQALQQVNVEITIADPKILIGQNGNTLFDLQRLLRIILTKILKENFYLELDINDYKKRKVDYLRQLAEKTAQQVLLSGKDKAFLPMPSYERKIIHMALAGREDVLVESKGEGEERYVVVSPK